jgi:hypothetical protein
MPASRRVRSGGDAASRGQHGDTSGRMADRWRTDGGPGARDPRNAGLRAGSRVAPGLDQRTLLESRCSTGDIPESIRTPESEIGGTGGVSASPMPASLGVWGGGPGVCGVPGAGVGPPGCDGPVGDGGTLGAGGVPGDGEPGVGVGDGAFGDGVGGFGAGAPGVGGAPVGPGGAAGCEASWTAGTPAAFRLRCSVACGPLGGGEPVMPASSMPGPGPPGGIVGVGCSPGGVVGAGWWSVAGVAGCAVAGPS